MAKLTDKQRKMIITESVEGSSIRALASKYKVSTTTIQRVLKSDAEVTQKVTQKKKENVASVLSFMDSKKNDVCSLIEKLLAAMGDKDKLAAAPVNQLATAMGILIDKYTAHESPSSSGAQANNLLEALQSCREGVNYDEIPELRSPAESDNDMVE